MQQQGKQDGASEGGSLMVSFVSVGPRGLGVG